MPEMTAEFADALVFNVLATGLQLHIPEVLGIEVDRDRPLRDQLPPPGQLMFDALTALVDPDDGD